MTEPVRRIILSALALPQLGIAVWALAAPMSFHRVIADFGPFNEHYVRDYALFAGAVGGTLVASVRWRSCRSGALALAAVWSGLHTVFHVLDFPEAHTLPIAIASLVLLALSTAAYSAAAIMFARAVPPGPLSA